MQVPPLPNKPEKHIDNATAGFMVATALLFDSLDVAPAALMTAATAAATAVGWVPFFGQLVGIAALGAGVIIEWALSALIAFCAFLTFFLWFKIHGVSLGFINRFAIRRLLIWLLCVLLESLPIPFLSSLPMLTVGTVASIMLSRAQDREELREWQGKVSRLERLFWKLAHDGVPHTSAQIHAVLREVRKDRKTHAKLKMALQQRTARERLNKELIELEAANDNIPRAANDNVQSERRRVA